MAYLTISHVLKRIILEKALYKWSLDCSISKYNSMYIDYNREIVRTRVAGKISADGCGRIVLAGEDVRISTYTDKGGRMWTVATYDLNPDYSESMLVIQEAKIRRALRMYVLNWIRQF